MNERITDIDLMQASQGTSTNAQGYALYVVLKQSMLNDGKIRLSLKGASPMSSSFLNSSLGELIDEFGIDRVKSSLSLVNYTASQARILKEYLTTYQKYAKK
ncbi:MAG: DUF4325 domain-containing protein [bacterium]